MSALKRPIHKRMRPRLEDSQGSGLERLDLQFTPFLVVFLGDREGRRSIFEALQSAQEPSRDFEGQNHDALTLKKIKFIFVQQPCV